MQTIKGMSVKTNGVRYRLGYYPAEVYKVNDVGWVWLGDEAPDPTMIVTGVVDAASGIYQIQLPSGQSMQVHASRLLRASNQPKIASGAFRAADGRILRKGV